MVILQSMPGQHLSVVRRCADWLKTAGSPDQLYAAVVATLLLQAASARMNWGKGRSRALGHFERATLYHARPANHPLTTSTPWGAFAAYASAWISSANFWETGAPPIITFKSSLSPASSSAFSTVGMPSIVVVKRADMASTSAE